MVSRFYHYFLIAFAVLLAQPSFAQDDFLDPEKAFTLSAQVDDSQTLHIDFSIAPDYYMYRERFELKAIATDNTHRTIPIEQAQLSNGVVKYDPTFDKDMEVYHHQALLTLPLNKLDSHGQAFTLEVTAQGCADAGLCYPPMFYYIPLTPTSTGYEISLPKLDTGASRIAYHEASILDNDTTTITNSSSFDLLNAGDTDIAHWLNQANLWQMLMIAFVLGLALSFTPCVLPMLPILLSLIVGTQTHATTRFQNLRLTLFYVLGTSIVYTILGVIAASIGAALANWIQNPWVLGLFALFLVLFGIAMLGAYNLQVPASIQTKLNHFVNKLPAGKNGGALLMGMLSALICGPCVAAPLAGILLFISQTGDITTGGLILFVLAWGQGASLILLGSSSGALLPRAGMWMNTVKQVCGLLLFAAALWMVSPLLPTWLPMVLWAALALAFAYIIGTFRNYKSRSFVNILLKLLGWLAVAWAIMLCIGLAMGSRSVLHPLKVSSSSDHVQFTRISALDELKGILAKTDKPVLLDFYADWCISCLEMEKFTFTDTHVQGLMNQMQLLQVDVTKNTAQDRELLKAFKLFGPPGIIFFDKKGQENRAIRVIGFQNAERFSQNLEKALNN
ncbi:protein-disulfide reductase DsbD [Pelistega suis]|uniref:protein-disulfide reductase DsbD n=1 Tax=Pelistega suis TaxID=1631957 RepID=UPI00211C875A|nr:protein-disulfide reductase DsbD [Pelistega suis]MCQ9329352.1 protein-disulfide reductase DsbD [Pelistega suis]